MDGISLDTHGKLNLTPLNMTLGNFNLETRIKEHAWETIYFHPYAPLESSRQSKKASPLESLKNLHNGLHAVLSSFHDTCQIQDGIEWDSLPYAGREWKSE